MPSSIQSKKFTVTSTDVIVEVQDIVSYLMSVPASTTGTVSVCMENNIIATPDAVVSMGSTVFDGTAHTVTRTNGSWIQEKFVVGMTITFANTVSNNASFTISAVTDKVLTVSSGLTNETSITATATGLYDSAAVWFLWNTTAGIGFKYEAMPYGAAPKGLRFSRTVGTGSVIVWIKS